MQLKVKKVLDGAQLPKPSTALSAGYDLFVPFGTEAVTLHPADTVMLSFGICIEIDDPSFHSEIVLRSSTGKRLELTNKIGIIDNDYRGEIKANLRNFSNETVVINPGDRICQLLIRKTHRATVVESDTLTGTERGSGGFGHTGA